MQRSPLWLRRALAALAILAVGLGVAGVATACSSQPSSYETVTADDAPLVDYVSYGGVRYCPIMPYYWDYRSYMCNGYGSHVVMMPLAQPGSGTLAYLAFMQLAGAHTWYMGGSYYNRYVYNPVTVVHHTTMVYQGHTLGSTGYKSSYVTSSEKTFNTKYAKVEKTQSSKVKLKDKNGNTLSGNGHVVKRAPKRRSGHVATTGPHTASTSKAKHTTAPAPRHTVRRAPPRRSTTRTRRH
jgi:hypothetical protein